MLGQCCHPNISSELLFLCSNVSIPIEVIAQSLPQSKRRVKYGLLGFCLLIVIFVGLIGNGSVVYLLMRRSLWAQVNRYLIAIAFWDSSLLLSSFAALVVPTLVFQGGFEFHGKSIVAIYPTAYMLMNASMVGCVWTTLTVTVERYMAIRYPVPHKRRQRRKRVLVAIMSVSFAALVYNVPRYFEMEALTCTSRKGAEIAAVGRTDLSESATFRLYRMVSGVALTTIGPCVVLFILTALIMRLLYKASVLRKQMRNERDFGNEMIPNGRSLSGVRGWPIRKVSYAHTRDSFVGCLLVLILCKFLMCYTLPTVIDIADIFPKNFEPNLLVYLVDLSDFLVVLHSATNFAIYVTFGKQFRKEFYKIYRIYKRKFSSSSMNNFNRKRSFLNWSDNDIPEQKFRKCQSFEKRGI